MFIFPSPVILVVLCNPTTDKRLYVKITFILTLIYIKKTRNPFYYFSIKGLSIIHGNTLFFRALIPIVARIKLSKLYDINLHLVYHISNIV